MSRADRAHPPSAAGPSAARPAGAPPPRAAPRSPVPLRLAVFARLTWFNAVRLFLHPLTLSGTVLGSYLLLGTNWLSGATTVEAWYDGTDSLATAVGTVMFAAAAFPAMREARYSTAPTSPLGRSGRLLSLMAASALVSTVFVAALACLYRWLSASPLPGTLSPPAYPAPFLLAAAGPLLSVVLVAWTRSYLPLFVAVLAVPAYWLYGVALAEVSSPRNAVFQMETVVRLTMHPFHVRAPSVTDVAALYLVYAVLVVAVLVFLALAARGSRTLRATCMAAAVVLLAGAAGTVVHGRRAHSYETPVPDSRVYGAHGSPCQTRNGVVYCPLPGYELWVDRWQEALDPALALLPEAARDRTPVIWQNSYSYQRDLDVPEGRGVMVYGGYLEEANSLYWKANLVADTARVLLDLPSPYEPHQCRATGQARMVLVSWLVSAGTGLAGHDRADFVAMDLFPHHASPVDLETALRMAELPEDRVSRVLEQNWERLSAPGGRTLELAELLGLDLRETSTAPAEAEDWDGLHPGHGYEEFTAAPERRHLPVCA